MVTTLLALAVVFLLPSLAMAEEKVTVKDDVKLLITEENGFLHPGLSVNPYQLEKTRRELIKGNPQYLAYFDAMVATSAASPNFGSGNLKEGTLHEPNWTAYNAQWQNMTLSKDSFKAYTSAIMYYLTGQDCYRYNAIRLVRIWSNLNPEEFKYFNDVHIHMPVPMFYLVAAAEMVKYTEPVNETYSDKDVTDYSLVWTKEDNEKLINNFLDPAQRTFYFKKDHYMNQHLYAVTGMMANAIFKNDSAQYAETVEMFTVNSVSAHLERNGALINQYKLIEADHPQNPIGEEFVQHREMGRDNAHSSGDVLMMTGLARILQQQGTKIDPVSGQITSSDNGQTIYAFLGNRLLDGTENWARYMAGYTVPWANTGQGMDFGGPISVAYRGRTGLYFITSELYDMYRFSEGMSATSLEERAPMLTYMAKNQVAPIFYNGTSKVNFWGAYADNKMTEIGCEYWLSMPLERQTDPTLKIPENDESCQLDFTVRGSIMDEKKVKIVSEDNKSFFSVTAVKNRFDLKETDYDERYPKDTKTIRGGNHFSLSSMNKKEYQAIRYRATKGSQLHLSSGNNNLPAHTIIELPSTDGEWKTLVYSTKDIVDTKALNLGNLDYYAVVSDQSDVVVDFDWLNYVNDGDGLKGTIVEFDKGLSQVRSLLKGQTLTIPIITSNDEGYTLKLAEPLKGVKLIDDVLSIDSKDLKAGAHKIAIKAQNADFVRSTVINLIVYDNQQAAFDLAVAEFDSTKVYTRISKQCYLKEKENVESKMQEGCSDTEFMEIYDALLKAAKGLELLNPSFEDGSFDYVAYSSILPTNKNAHNLLDNDDATYSGDLRRPYIFDFGRDYRITATSFNLQTRRGFANRYKGFNVYGSDDNKNFTLLTERSTKQVNEMESINVKEEFRNRGFRYLALSCDEPGPPTDPEFPGISSFGEFHIFGERIEVDDKIKTAEIFASNLKNMLLPGDEVRLEIEATEVISDLDVTIEGIKAELTKKDDLNWTAKIKYPAGKTESSEVPITINYKNANGEQGPTLYETTNQVDFFKSDDSKLIKDPISRISKTSNGSVESAKAWFDNDLSTMGEYGKVSGSQAVFAQFDFSDGPIKLDRIEFLARQDQYASRAAYYEVHGSQDGQTWTNIAPRGRNTQDWQAITVKDEFKDIEYNFIQIYCWANNIGLTELRILGEQGEPKFINTVKEVTFETPGMKNMIKPGETLKLNIKAESEIVDLDVSIMDIKADVVSQDGLNWVASIVFPEGVVAGSSVPINVDYKDKAGKTGITFKQTTDGGTVYPSDDAKKVNGLFERVYETSNRTPKDTSPWFDNDILTGSEFFKESSGQTYVAFDFSDNPIKVDRLEFLARQDKYCSRAKSYEFQVSQDGKTWISTGSRGKETQDWQGIVVSDKEKDTFYNYVRVYAWAQYLCLNEMRLIGEQQVKETVDLVDTVSITSNNVKQLATPKDKITLSFKMKEAVKDVKVKIAGIEAVAISEDGVNWDATIELPENLEVGWGIDFTVDYTSTKGNPGKTVTDTTDGSTIFKSTNENLVFDAANRVYQTSNRNPSDAAAWFDNDLTTNSEFYKNGNDGNVFVALDFSDGPITLDRLEFLARQDQYASRAKAYRLQASVDGKNWQDIGKSWGKNSQDWQIFEIADDFKETEFKYVRIYSWATHLNAVEVRLFGEQRKLADKTYLSAALLEANTRLEVDYTTDSWRPFVAAKMEAETIVEDDAAVQETIDLATTKLQEAMDKLILFVRGEDIIIDCKNAISIKIGQSVQVKAAVIPENASNRELIFKSGNDRLASVSDAGVIKGMKAGRTTITITSQDGLKKDIIVQILK